MGRGLLETLAGSIDRHRLLRQRDTVLIAVSGGPDSVALLHALVMLDRGGWRIAIGHVNHRLRGRDSERDERFVRRLGQTIGCPVHVVDAPVLPGPDLEERAREARYAALLETARRERFRRVATAHTQDDQAETVLHRLLRGSGPGGLVGIAPVREDGIVRPLLDVSRAAVVRFLAERGIRYRVDRTNASPRFTRNRIRGRVLPVLEREINPRAKTALARLAEILRDDEVVLDALAKRRSSRFAVEGALECRGLATQPVGLQRRIVRRWLGEARGGLGAIDLDHIEALRALASGRKEGSVSIPAGSVARARGRLHWIPGGAAVDETALAAVELGTGVSLPGWRLTTRETTRRFRPTLWRASFDLDQLDEEQLRVRGRRPGDRIDLLGLAGRKKLQDVFVDGKVPRSERAGWPVVECGDRILWVPGLARSRHAPIGAHSRRLLVLDARRASSRRGRRSLRCRKKSVVLPSS